MPCCSARSIGVALPRPPPDERHIVSNSSEAFAAGMEASQISSLLHKGSSTPEKMAFIKGLRASSPNPYWVVDVGKRGTDHYPTATYLKKHHMAGVSPLVPIQNGANRKTGERAMRCRVESVTLFFALGGGLPA